MALTPDQISSLLAQRSITDAWPWSSQDSAAVDRHIVRIIREVCAKLGLLAKEEYGHYGSGYASYVDCWLYRDNAEFQLGEPSSYCGLVVLIRRLLERCEVYSSDLRIRIDATDLSTFPDATVVCGDICASPIDSNAVTNPTIIVEVTSASTEDYDRAEKLSSYKQLESLHAVLIVSHRRPQITVVERNDEGFSQREHRAAEHVVLRSPELRIAVDDVYRGVELRPGGGA